MKFPLLSKALALAGVFALLWLTLARIDSLVAERRHRKVEATRNVEQSSAGAQTLMGPLLYRTCTEEWDVVEGQGKDRRTTVDKRQTTLVSSPNTLDVTGNAVIEPRHRSLFTVNGFVNTAELVARWSDLPSLEPTREHAGSRLQCGAVTAMLAISDVRGLRSAQLQIDGLPATWASGTDLPRYPRGLHAPLPPSRASTSEAPLVIKASLELIGNGRLALVPAAGQSHWSLRSDWPHPSFDGRFLPTAHEIRADGFTAQWSVSALASSASDDLHRGADLCVIPEVDSGDTYEPTAPTTRTASCLDTIGVSFYEPANPYVLTDRATKYALLFIVLTFASVALVEVLAGVRVHPVQYTLVGLAMVVFYLLLLSVSEHTSFGTAYAIASTACVALLTFYATHILGRYGTGLSFGLGVSLLYALLWVLLRMEQSALLIGSLILFGALAGVMVLTRKVDWYEVVGHWRRAATPQPLADKTE